MYGRFYRSINSGALYTHGPPPHKTYKEKIPPPTTYIESGLKRFFKNLYVFVAGWWVQYSLFSPIHDGVTKISGILEHKYFLDRTWSGFRNSRMQFIFSTQIEKGKYTALSSFKVIVKGRTEKFIFSLELSKFKFQSQFQCMPEWEIVYIKGTFEP